MRACVSCYAHSRGEFPPVRQCGGRPLNVHVCVGLGCKSHAPKEGGGSIGGRLGHAHSSYGPAP
eukprot:15084932-Alexandrium_andersonii.AAC.1